MVNRRRWAAGALSVLLAVMLVVTGCSSNSGGGNNPAPQQPADTANNETANNEPAAAEPEPADPEPFAIKMAVNFDGKDVPQAGNPVQQAIESYTHTQLEIDHFPGNSYQDKLSVMIASGDLPQVIASYGAPKQSYLLSAFQNDVFWDISPFIKDFPNLSSLNQAIYDNVAFQGKVFGLPRERPLARDAFIYRVDWLKNVGLQEPQTVEEFHQLLKAFKDQDPDKNGKNDTYGMTMGALGGSGPAPSTFGVFFGAPNVWDVQEGKFTRDVFTPEYLEGLKFQKQLFDEGLIHPDFAIMDRPKVEGEFENSKAGVIANSTNVALSYEARIQQHIPDATVDFFSILSTDKGKRIAAALGSNGILMFPKSSVKTEDDLKKILKFFDQLADQEMADLLEWGIEGTHYTMKDGKPEIIDQEKFDNEVGFPYKWPLRAVSLDAIKMQGNVNPLVTKELQVTTENQNHLVNNPANPFISQTQVERGAELELIITDANTKFIMGVMDEAKWKSEMDRWLSSGGDQIAKEYEEQWAAAQ
ncbi:extracellular solute-binding protein [Paenibacillus sepulcri]|uniref:Extracellular solute-binding protein n=1 Tax=Paenibacillus sepulcri TaxID=359917 RepID=A0ABS7C1K0_9BACL|nr:extracellular solute-binding protein [Paenibacillus sepulcri]